MQCASLIVREDTLQNLTEIECEKNLFYDTPSLKSIYGNNHNLQMMCAC